MEGEALATLRKVFMVYGAFWVTVLIVLYFGVGALMSRAEKKKPAGH